MMYPTAGSVQATTPNHCPQSDRDMTNFVLAELKRVTREYATAALEANHPMIRERFTHLMQRSLQDQSRLYDTMNQLGMYGQLSFASQQEVYREQQKHAQSGYELQSFLQQNLHNTGNAPSMTSVSSMAAAHGMPGASAGMPQPGYSPETQSGNPSFASALNQQTAPMDSRRSAEAGSFTGDSGGQRHEGASTAGGMAGSDESRSAGVRATPSEQQNKDR